MSVNRVPLFIPWITEEDKQAVLEALSSRWLTGGPRTREFETKFAEYVGVKHAIACSSCTSALHVALRALDVGPSDEVIVPVLTFAATANAALFVGAKPVFADVEDRTLNIACDEITKRITPKTKAIIPVHYGGQPCDMREITEIAEDHDLFVVEDCAHSLGAEYGGKQTGSFGKAGCFSFYPTKNITTGEGGMLTTDDDSIARRARLFIGHCMTTTASERESARGWYYDVIDVGYNYRLTDVQAALGISQLKRVNEAKLLRIHVADLYNNELSRIAGIRLPFVAPSRTHTYHLYTIRISDEYGLSRDELFKQLSSLGIGLSVHYTPLHMLTNYRERLGHKAGDFPTAEQAYARLLTLPLYPTMSMEELSYVANSIRAASTSPPLS